MPLQATSGAASYDAFGGGVPAIPQYIEDYFSTYLYTGTGSAQTITNGIDLSTFGGLVWTKGRGNFYSNTRHGWFDTNRGVNKFISSNLTEEQGTESTLTNFRTTGFSLGTDVNYAMCNGNTEKYVSWTFRKQPKFFDVVTYTGNGSTQNIAHNLGSTPGCIIVKEASAAGNDWQVYHRSTTNTCGRLFLNLTNAENANGRANTWGDNTNPVPPTSTVFTVGNTGGVNNNGNTYVAYVFAHNAGGFGLTGTDNVISCGTFDANLGEVINLGYEPQWLLYKASADVDNWRIADNMRGLTNLSGTNAYTIQQLRPNSSAVESENSGPVLTSTGFTWNQSGGGVKHIYIAIRRGPMKVPTSGTSVYKANTYTGNATANTTVAGNFGFPVDLMLLSSRSANSLGWAAYGQVFLDRLRGSNDSLGTGAAGGEDGGWSTYNAFDVKNSIGWGLYGANSGTDYFNNSGGTWVAQGFARAPNFFDEVCYSGTGSATTRAHNLGVVPELIIVKQRSGSQDWPVYVSSLGATKAVFLNTTAAETVNTCFNDTTPTSSVFSVGSGVLTNGSGSTYVAWLFATLAGVSKVGSYTGNGSTQTIDCGFGAGGARFVLIKRTDSTSDWFMYDTARGMTVLTDPYLRLNTTGAEVATLGSVTTVSTGFALNSTILAAINVSAGTYIFLAIA
jgi:hypothetical protein